MRFVLLCILLMAIEIKAEELYSDRLNLSLKGTNSTDPSITVNAQDLYVVSSFVERDYFTVYSHTGDLIWEVPLNAQIISWKIHGDLLFIFSKARGGLAYYLICLKASDGALQWEKAIVAPSSNPQ